LDQPLVEKMLRLLEMLKKKLDGQLVDYSPQEEKDLCARLVDDFEFFSLVYDTFNSEPTQEQRGAAEKLYKYVEKKGGIYPYPNTMRLRSLLESYPTIIAQSKSRLKFKAFDKFASAQMAYKVQNKITPVSFSRIVRTSTTAPVSHIAHINTTASSQRATIANTMTSPTRPPPGKASVSSRPTTVVRSPPPSHNPLSPRS